MQGRDGIEEVALPTLSSTEPAISISRRPSSTHDPLSAAPSIKSNGDGNVGHSAGGKDGEDRERQDGQSSGSKADTEKAQPLYAGRGRSGNDSVSKGGRQVSAAIGMAWNKYVLLAEMPIPTWDGRKKRVKWGKMSGTEAVWNAGYVLGVLVLSFQSSEYMLILRLGRRQGACCGSDVGISHRRPRQLISSYRRQIMGRPSRLGRRGPDPDDHCSCRQEQLDLL